MMPSVFQIVLLLVMIFLVLVPIVLVAISKRTSGWAKFGWVVAAVLFSWLGYIAMRISTRDRAQATPE